MTLMRHETLGTLLRALAVRDGHAERPVAEAYVAGRLGRVSVPPGLWNEPVPTSEQEAEAVAARHRVLGWALWAVVREHAEEQRR
jgi:hypothetical protein